MESFKGMFKGNEGEGRINKDTIGLERTDVTPKQYEAEVLSPDAEVEEPIVRGAYDEGADEVIAADEEGNAEINNAA